MKTMNILLEKFSKFSLLLLLVSGLIVLGSCGDDDEGPTPTQTIWEIVSTDSRTSSLKVQLEAAGLDSDLNGTGQFTLFAPSNQAMANLLTTLQLDNFESIAPAVVQQVLSYHLVASQQQFSQLSGNLTTVQGESITVVEAGGTKTLDTGATTDAGFTAQDIMATNGVIHIVDVVLVPPSIGALIVQTLGTVAQPILLSSSFSTLSGAIQKADAGKEPQNTIVGALIGSPSVTVFAPVNEVFAGASITVDTYSSEEWDAILRGHVVPQTISPLEDGEFPTFSGSSIAIMTGSPSMVEGTANENPVPIVAAGVGASNGIIYPIGGIILHD